MREERGDEFVPEGYDFKGECKQLPPFNEDMVSYY